MKYKPWLIWGFLTLAVVALSSTVFATTYYIDSVNGNDGKPGSAPANAWKTLAKVSSYHFLPGDVILLNRGSIWYETLTMGSAGTSGNPIRVDAYGTGNPPVIDGRSRASYGVVLWSKPYVSLSNLRVQNVQGYGFSILNSANVTVAYCTLNNVVSAGIIVSGASPSAVIDHCVDFNSAGVAGYNFIKMNTTAADNPTISNNTVGDLGRGYAINLNDVSNANIFDNVISGNGQAISVHGITRNVTGIQIHDNYAYACSWLQGDGECIEVVGSPQSSIRADIYRNFVKGGPTTGGGIDAYYATNCRVYNNIVMNTYYGAFHWTTHNTNNVFYNNTVYNAARYGFLFATGSTGNAVKNNIIERTGWSGIAATDDSLPVEDYNIIHRALGGLRSINISAGAHTITSDPLFVSSMPSTAEDFSLQSGSPAIDSGENLGAPYNYAFDPQGSSFPYPVLDQNLYPGWERGAFVFRPNASVSSTATVPNSISNGSEILTGLGSGYVSFGQSFTATQTGRVSQITFDYITKFGTVTDAVYLEVHDDDALNGGNLLATSSPVAAANIRNGHPTSFSITFDAVRNSLYYVKVFRTGANDATNYFAFRTGTGNPYSGWNAIRALDGNNMDNLSEL
jgi:parallel beta-helix repeat protein